jgi:hypothetical protein
VRRHQDTETPSLGHMAHHLVNVPKWQAWQMLPEVWRGPGQGRAGLCVCVLVCVLVCVCALMPACSLHTPQHHPCGGVAVPAVAAAAGCEAGQDRV